eukprot:5651626-Pyramimonas_sp.AAC.1
MGIDQCMFGLSAKKPTGLLAVHVPPMTRVLKELLHRGRYTHHVHTSVSEGRASNGEWRTSKAKSHQSPGSWPSVYLRRPSVTWEGLCSIGASLTPPAPRMVCAAPATRSAVYGRVRGPPFLRPFESVRSTSTLAVN